MNPLWVVIIGWLVLTSFVGFLSMGIDKARAQDGSRRIPEKTFFKMAIIGGAIGILAGSTAFHHKTLKDSFIEIIAMAAIAWVIVLLALEVLLGTPFG